MVLSVPKQGKRRNDRKIWFPANYGNHYLGQQWWPLVNEKGEVVGVNSQIAFADLPDGSQILQQQINFALEADITKN